MKRFASVLMIVAIAAVGRSAGAAGDPKAADLVGQAKAAIGGEKQIAKIKSLTLAGTAVRAIGDRQMSGEFTIDLQLPDKMVRIDSISPMGDATVVTEQGLNGDTLIRSSKVINAPPGAMIRTPPPPAAGSDAEAQALRNSRAELARLAIGLLITPPGALPVEFSYGGEAESPDGKADVIDLKGEGSFLAKLFLDKATHRPLMLSYRGVSPRIVVQTERVQAPRPAQAEGGAHGEPGAPAAPELVDIAMFFDDYKSIDGVMLPHHITRSVDGHTSEEWTLKTIKVNPSFKADTFSKR